MDIFHDSAKDKRIVLTYKISSLVPKYIFSDEVTVNQILSNLISNAIKYTETKGTVTVEVDYIEAGHGIIFKVIDNGV